MKIGACVIFDSMNTIRNKFTETKGLGFDNCQLLSWNPSLWTDENAELVKRYAGENGITISAFWNGWTGPQVWDFYDGPITLGLVPPEYRAMRIKELHKGSDFAKKMCVTDVITHMGFIPENPNDPNFMSLCVAIRTVAEYCRKNDQYLLFETGQETPTTMLRCFETVNMPNLGVNFDTANLMCYGKANSVDALKIIGKYVRNIHAKDTMYPVNGHDLGKETRIGDGEVDFEGVFNMLKSLGYNSYVTIEREISGQQQIDDILYAKKFLEDVIDRVYGD